MATQNIPTEQLTRPESIALFKRIRVLATLYAVINSATLGVIYALRNHHNLVNDTVWTRGSILAVTSILLFVFISGITRGSHKALLRVRIITAILLASVLALLIIPGLLPVWMKIEQGVCGLLLIGIIALVNGSHSRALFKTK